MIEAIALCEEIAGRELEWELGPRAARRRSPLVDLLAPGQRRERPAGAGEVEAQGRVQRPRRRISAHSPEHSLSATLATASSMLLTRRTGAFLEHFLVAREIPFESMDSGR